jgi:Tfp pilus assembly protein PilV
MQNSTESRRGVALIETVVAAGILTVAAAFLVHFIVMGLFQTTLARARASAVLFAQEQMEFFLAYDGGEKAWEDRLRRQYNYDGKTDTYECGGTDNIPLRWSWAIEQHDMSAFDEAVIRVYWRPPGQVSLRKVCELRSLCRIEPNY